MDGNGSVVGRDEPVLITGANGFIGSKVVEKVVEQGFTKVRCFVRSAIASESLRQVIETAGTARIEIVRGNLLSSDDCESAVQGVRLVYHLAAATEARSFRDARKESVDATRIFLDALLKKTQLVRFVHVSSFAVYSNLTLPAGALLDESCPLESKSELRGEAYSYAKVKQEELLRDYSKRYGMPCVIVRPGAVYGPGSRAITGRVGIPVGRVFLHLGGENIIPFTYVDNCAEAIVLAGTKRGVDGEAINVVDDGVLTSREFLAMYKRHVEGIRSIGLPKRASYSLFWLLGTSARLLHPGAPSRYSRRRWCAYWKGNTYTNEKLKRLLGWSPRISLEEGMRRYFAYCREPGE